jgi:hypothetical protein
VDDKSARRDSCNTRRLEPVETRTLLAVGFVLVIVGVLVAVFPRLIAHPIVTPCSLFAGRGDRLSL